MKKTKVVLSSFILLFFVSVAIFGQGGLGKDKGDHQGKGNFNKIPGITEEQNTKIEALNISFRRATLSLNNQLDELRAKQRTLTTSDKADMKAIYSNIDEITKLENQIMKKSADHQQDIRVLLNDEQRLWFDTNHHKHGKQGKFDNSGRKPHVGKSEKENKFDGKSGEKRN